jgi:hypothetical protein
MLLVLLSGFAGLLTGVLVGRNITIRTNPTSGVKAFVYVIMSGLFIAVFMGPTIFIAYIMDYLY